MVQNKTILTKRLKIRSVEKGDVPILIALMMDSEVRKHLGGPIEPESAKKKAVDYINKDGFFCIVKLDDSNIIGLCSLDKYRKGDIEVSYQFFPEYWGNGFGREAIEAIINLGFLNMKINTIIAVTQESNIKSRRLLESIGMTIIDKFVEFNEKQVMYKINKI